MSLTAKQRAHLKSLAHPMKAIQHIGKEGVTEAVTESVDAAFRTRELLKVKVLETAPAEVRATGETLVAALPDAELVQVIGRTLVLYRRHPTNPEIRLP